jgi:hypothetical protein
VSYVAAATNASGRRGGYLVTPSQSDGLFLACGEIHDIAFASDSTRVAILDDEGARITVWRLPSGDLERTLPRAWAPRFLSSSTLVYRSGCAIESLDLSKTDAAASTLLGDECGGVDATPDGKRWMIVSGPSYAYAGVLSYRPYDRLVHFDAERRATKVLVGGTQSRKTFDDPRLSPAGDRVCYGGAHLRCIDVATGDDDLVDAGGSAHKLVFSEEGDQAIYAGFGGPLWHADFRTWTKRKLRDGEGARYWAFFPGGTRAIAYNEGAIVYDLVKGRATEVFPKSVEVGGFGTIGRSATRFTLGQEVGAGRTLYFFEIAE